MKEWALVSGEEERAHDVSGSSAPRSARTGPSGDARPSGLRPPHGAKALHFTGHMDGRARHARRGRGDG